MSGLSIILLVLFVIVCVLIVFLVLLQNEEGDSIGGLFAGGSGSAFGSKSSNVLTKTTYVLVALFFVMTFSLALLNRTKSDRGLIEEAQKQQSESGTEWYKSEKQDKKIDTDIDNTNTDANQDESNGEADGNVNTEKAAPEENSNNSETGVNPQE